MLALTPVPLTTAGERAVFGELTRWDTGGSVRAGVMASLPLADGPSQRRTADAVLFVPEGLAVVRIVEVVRQSGVVTANPAGAWTIAPESGPSQALQLSGGGSSPLDGLMRAGMDTAVTLRRAGLEPGRIARLTILVGDIPGLLPADGDLGEGDQVALLEPRSLLLGIARASRYTGVDNPRLWTTADVRAALEALGLEGRGPSVAELNGEGFPYSPYVLRRAELLTPAAMAAASESAASQALAASLAPLAVTASQASQAPPAVLPGREPPVPGAVGQAVAATAAAGWPPPEAQSAEAPVQRDTVAIDEPQEDAGIGGLFAGSEDDSAGRPEVDGRTPDRGGPDRAERKTPAGTSVFPVSGPAPGTSVFPVAEPAPGPSVFGSQSPAPAAQRFAYWNEDPAAGTPGAPDGGDEPARRGRAALLVVVGLVVAAALGLGVWAALGDRDGRDVGTASGSAASQTAAPGPQVGGTQTAGATEYTVQAVELAATCAGHAYGAVADFLATTDCTGLSRALYSAEVDGAPVVVSVIRVQMPDTTAARELRSLADRNGTGNVSDLLREGVRYTGSPAELSGAEYASALSGPVVTIVEAAPGEEDGRLGTAELDRVAGEALALEVLPFPTG